MISPADIQVTKTHLTLFATVLLVSNLVESQLFKTAPLNAKWVNLLIATLVGVALHGLVITNNLAPAVNKSLKIKNTGVRQSVTDFFMFSTIFISQKVLTSQLAGVPIVFDKVWAMTSGLTIAGYAMFNILVQKMVPTINAKLQPLLNDLIKVSMGNLLAVFIVEGTITQTHLLSLGALLSGFVAFHLVVKGLVLKEKFGLHDSLEYFGSDDSLSQSDSSEGTFQNETGEGTFQSETPSQNDTEEYFGGLNEDQTGGLQQEDQTGGLQQEDQTGGLYQEQPVGTGDNEHFWGSL
jgi:hypothetical protein